MGIIFLKSTLSEVKTTPYFTVSNLFNVFYPVKTVQNVIKNFMKAKIYSFHWIYISLSIVFHFTISTYIKGLVKRDRVPYLVTLLWVIISLCSIYRKPSKKFRLIENSDRTWLYLLRDCVFCKLHRTYRILQNRNKISWSKVIAVEMRKALLWRNHYWKWQDFEIMNLDIIFILDQTKLLREPFWIGHRYYCIQGQLKFRLQSL